MMKIMIAALTALILVGCSTVDLKTYQDNQPKFSLFDYFEGDTKGWGIVQDRGGKLIRQFVVYIDGSIEGDTLTLDERFEWSDGEKSTRVWQVTRTGERTFTGTANDVEGIASGSVYGNVLNWQYYLNIEVDGTTWKVHLDDWMFLQPDDVLLNRAAMSKFGIHLGDITITFKKNNNEGAK